MTTLWTRSALIAWGKNPAPNVASVIQDYRGRRVVTWDDVMAQRRSHQARQLAWKRAYREWRAYKLYVYYSRGFGSERFFEGWQAMLETYRQTDPDRKVWIDRNRSDEFRRKLMAAFPFVLPLGRDSQQWEVWKAAFAKAYQRRTHYRHPVGVCYVWWDGYDTPEPMARGGTDHV